MANQIEKLNRMRKYFLWGILVGTFISLLFLIYPTFYSFFSHDRLSIPIMGNRLFDGALILWLITILTFLAQFCLYRIKLRKKPSLQTAVYDERIKMNWLKSYRFSFIITIAITIAFEIIQALFSAELLKLKFILPNGPFLVLWAAIISLAGSFLYYNRDANNE